MRLRSQILSATPLLVVLVAAFSITPVLSEVLTNSENGTGPQPVESGDIHQVESSSLSTLFQYMPFSAGSGSSADNSNIDSLWQHVCQITSFLSSSTLPRQLVMTTIQGLEHDHDDLYSSQKSPGSVHNSSGTHPTANSTPITISLAFLPADEDISSISPSSSSPSASEQHSPTPKHEENAITSSSSPIDSKGSYMAILVSLSVAIMWF